MIIELKDIPTQPIKKLDIHIEFSDNGITVTSLTSPPRNIGNPVSQDIGKSSQESSKEPSEIPQEMLNADF